MIARLVHQFPRKDRRLVFISNAAERVDASEDVIDVVLVLGETTGALRFIEKDTAIRAAQAFPGQPLGNAAVGRPIIFIGRQELEIMRFGGLKDVIKLSELGFVVNALGVSNECASPLVLNIHKRRTVTLSA